MSSLLPIRRRRFGMCSTKTLASGLCLFILVITFLKLNVGRPERAVGLEQDLAGTDEGRLNRGHAVQEVEIVSDEPEQLTRPSHAKGNEATLSGERKRNAFVVASQRTENTTWLDQFFPEWEKLVYHVDEPWARLKVPKNKGREGMVYLTYIIDNYDDLPDYILFIHPTRFQWHNDDPDYDGVRMLRNFQLTHLKKEGYVNMRCAWVLGCPAEIRPFDQEDHHREDIHAGEYYKKAFMELFPGKPIPEVVGASCCAQFGATREKILERPKSDYEHYRKWIMHTDLEDAISGRVLEYSWHMIFGKEPVHCPVAKTCYCDVFGMCDLDCNNDSCKGRYDLPPYAVLPGGWPAVGWDGKPRNFTPVES